MPYILEFFRKKYQTPEEEFKNLESEYLNAYITLFHKLKYNHDLLHKIDNSFKYNFEKYQFLRSCEDGKLDSHTVFNYLNSYPDYEFEELRSKEYKMLPTTGSCSNWELTIIFNIRKSVKQDTLDYYDQRLLKNLSDNGLATLNNMAVYEIQSTIRFVDNIDYHLVTQMAELKEKRKLQAKRWVKVLDLMRYT